MKRYGQLFENFTAFPNLLLAYQKARRGAVGKPEAQAFAFHLEGELFQLQDELMNGSYQPRPYRYFQIYDPKERTISVAAFRDRVVHHALINILEPIYERCFIFDSYATRKGKGTHKAIRRAQQFLRRTGWFWKSDIDKYFDSIRQDMLRDLLERKVKDKRLLEIAGRIVCNGGAEGVGLPIGNLTSQFFANVYLNGFDHFVKEDLGVKYYLRYMDDFALFSPDKTQLKSWRGPVRKYLNDNLGLQLKASASFLNSAPNGLTFLGRRIFPKITPAISHVEHARIATKTQRHQIRTKFSADLVF
ncbi:MAG: group II intron reverse transcriptase domain-containing protein [Lewinellaceae bacterium]|nr:group II intron reverse transcriptase domain-containing protein [Lewinellaceae bacterium]